MLPERVMLYGRDEPLPDRQFLRAGPVTAIWENGDLRYIKLGEIEVIRRIYVAIRDRNWGTIAPSMSNLAMDLRTDSFRLDFDIENRQGEIDFAWRGEIAGSADGVIRFSMDGIARSTFLRNRIGFCVLHPAEAAGAAARAIRADGHESGVLPVDVISSQPVQPFAEMIGMSHEVLPGVWADLQFSGDVFEMEDQRNWTDASFKTFCTPLRLPFPVEIRAGTRVQQSITLSLRDERPKASASWASGPAPLTFTVDPDAPGDALPEIGLGLARHGLALSPREVARLKALKLGHLRADLRLARPGYVTDLRRATGEAAALGVPLHLALFVAAEAADQELSHLRRTLDELRPPIAVFLVYAATERFGGGTPIAEAVAAARRHLGSWPGARLATGTNADYIFLARNMPPLDLADALTFAIHPQEHAFDNASLVETLGTQATVVAGAQRLGGGLPVMVSPATLRRRFNPHATAPEPDPSPGTLPASVDTRQMSLLGAGWTLGSIKYLAAASASSVTYYETTGWRGVMETEAGSAVQPFQSLAGAVFPLYHVLADVAEFAAGAVAGGAVAATRSSDPLAVEGLALQQGDRLCVMVANMTPQLQTVLMRGLRGPARTRVLDSASFDLATRNPEAFRACVGGEVASSRNLALELPPHAIARVDAQGGV